MDVSYVMHLLVERVRVLYVLIVKQREAEATIQRCHFSTLSGEDVPRQSKSEKLQPVVRTERRWRLIGASSPALTVKHTASSVSTLRICAGDAAGR